VTAQGNWFQVYARGVGIVNTQLSEPLIGPDFNATDVDDSTAPAPLLGTPYLPVPPLPESTLGPLTVNPDGSADGSSSSGLGALLDSLLGGGG
jgi:hypothetical protein